ncbi:hypothetical protein WBG06_23605 [Nocardioides sp. CCNWLW239]|uniref:hypothetical protein n=1 Tax=Nocardioides sp. CCNWLW239 TaxID=3128902 RepID=UPI003015E677
MKCLASTLRTSLAAGALVIVAVMTMSPPARAFDGTYAPHGGTGVSLIGNNVNFTVVEANQTFDCKQFDLSGSVLDPDLSRPFGTSAATWDQIVASGCFNPTMGDTTFDQASTWGLAITGPEVGSVSPAAITDVAIFVEMNACSFNISGEMSGDFDDATGVFTPTGSTLTISDDPAGYLCPIIGLDRGLSIQVSGPLVISGLTITNP